MKKKGLLSWVLEFAGRKRGYFVGSVVLAILGVAASFGPYLIIAKIVKQLLADNREWDYYLSFGTIGDGSGRPRTVPNRSTEWPDFAMVVDPRL